MRIVPPETLGACLHRARKRQGWSIRELAEAAQVNKNSIVRLEKGGVPQPLTVLKGCAAMSIHVASITNAHQPGAKNYVIHRRENDRWFDLVEFGGEPLVDPPTDAKNRRRLAEHGINVVMLPSVSRLEEGRILPSLLESFGESQTRSHVGEEFIYVLSGRATITIGCECFELLAGESVTFWSSELHTYTPAAGEELPVRILSVILHQTDQ